MLLHPIHHTFAPHVDLPYALQTLLLLFSPWKWKTGPESEKFREQLAAHFDRDCTLSASGREALLGYLEAINLNKGDEVIIQAYTCVVVPNAIKAAGGIPIYCDISRKTLNLDCEKLPDLITSKTKAIICQHTFGIPADTETLRRICDQHGILLIEDCAHIIPDQNGPSSIGKEGDAILLSFGRDKAISGVSGGAILTKGTAVRKPTKHLSLIAIKRYLLYPIIYFSARPLMGIGIGKAILKLASILTLLPPIVSSDEKKGSASTKLHSMPNACCALALKQLRKLQNINNHRRKLTKKYLEACIKNDWNYPTAITADLPLQKFPLFIEPTTNNQSFDKAQDRQLITNTLAADSLRTSLKSQNIHLEDGWSGAVVNPRSVNQEEAGYQEGSCPHAEEIARSILPLPTHPTTSYGQIVGVLRTLEEKL